MRGGVDVGVSLISPDGVAPSHMVGVSACYPRLRHKVQKKISSGTGSPGSRVVPEKGLKNSCGCVFVLVIIS